VYVGIAVVIHRRQPKTALMTVALREMFAEIVYVVVQKRL
jgi:hypothetical protein